MGDKQKYTISMDYDAFIIVSDIRCKKYDYEVVHQNMEKFYKFLKNVLFLPYKVWSFQKIGGYCFE